MRGPFTKVIFSTLFILKVAFLFSQDSLQNDNELPLSMTEVWQKATEHSKKIQLMTFETEIREKEIREAQVERLPEVSVKGHLEYASNLAQYTRGILEKPEQHEVIHFLYRIGTDAYLPLYHGNKLNLAVDKKKLLYQISEEQKNYTASEIRLQAAIYYLQLQRTIIYRDLMVQDILNQEKQLLEIRHLYETGVVLKSDVLRIELKLSNQKFLLVRIENDLAIANQKLNILIGLPDEQRVDPNEQLAPHLIQLKSYEEYLKEAMEKSFEYHISEKQTELANVQLHAIKANVRPRIGLYGDMWLANPQIFLFPYSPSNYTLNLFGLRASLPVSELYMNRPREKIAMLELEKEELAHHDTEDKIRQDVYEAYLRFKEAITRIEVAKVNVDHAQENARIVRNNYFNQTALVTDLLDADVQFLQTNFELASAQIEAQLHYYRLQHILGNL